MTKCKAGAGMQQDLLSSLVSSEAHLEGTRFQPPPILSCSDSNTNAFSRWYNSEFLLQSHRGHLHSSNDFALDDMCPCKRSCFADLDCLFLELLVLLAEVLQLLFEFIARAVQCSFGLCQLIRLYEGVNMIP